MVPALDDYGCVVAPELTRAVFEANPDAVLIVAADGMILDANPMAHEMFHYEPAALIGQPVEILVPEMSRHRHIDLRSGYVDQAIARPMGLGMGLMAQRADGSNIPVEISLSPTSDRDGVVTIATVRDVTDRLADRSESRRNASRLQLLEDRERIGRDLHDMVIQRLFAAGMSLQAVAAIAEPESVAERIMGTIDALDDTIRDIRNTIFELHLRRDPAPSERLGNLIDDRSELLGFRPSISVTREIDDLSSELIDDLLATLAEALSNAIRHAGASAVDVTIERQSRGLCLRVTDDGVGMPDDPTGGHGLSNILWRAANHGGRCVWSPADGGGTVMEWHVPIVN